MRSHDTSPSDLLRWLIAPRDTAPRDDPGFARWWIGSREQRAAWLAPFDRAVVGGYLAGRVAYAFAAGYQAALQRLAPGVAAADRVVSLSVTEDGGGHPRAIESTLRPDAGGSGGRWLLSGHKKWATLSPDATSILVAASMGTDADGRKRIRLVHVDRDAAGVEVKTMPTTAFTPEITHGELDLRDVRVTEDRILPGDGFEDYIKPFRTLEDAHVNGAVMGHLFEVATRCEWPRETREELLDLIVNLRTLALGDASAPEIHIALAGFFSVQRRTLESARVCWDLVDAETRERWERDSGLMGIAGSARSRRREVAWTRAEKDR